VILTESLNRAAGVGAKARRYTQILLVDDSTPARREPEEPGPVLAELSRLNPDTMTPMQALAKLAELKTLAKKSNGTDPKEAER
jgi:DNA mismatch repair protein MutS